MDEATQAAYANELFHVRRSVKYHDRRNRFFENVLNGSMFVALIGGVAFIVLGLGMFSAQEMEMTRLIPGIITSMATAFALLSKSTMKSNLHNQLKARFIHLRQEMERNRDCTSGQVAEWTAQRLAIEVEEPPINRIVDAMCHNEVTYSMGHTEAQHYVRVRFWHRLFGPFTRYFDHRLRMYQEGERGPYAMSR